MVYTTFFCFTSFLLFFWKVQLSTTRSRWLKRKSFLATYLSWEVCSKWIHCCQIDRVIPVFKSTWYFEFDFLEKNPGGGEVPTALCCKLFYFDSSAFKYCHFINVACLCASYINVNPCSFRVTFAQNHSSKSNSFKWLINISYKLLYHTIIFIKRVKFERNVFGKKKWQNSQPGRFQTM